MPSLSVRLSGESAMVPREAVMVVTSPSERESEASCRESVVTSESSEMVSDASASAVASDSKPPPENPAMERVSVIGALV